jgi:hypothetical protein
MNAQVQLEKKHDLLRNGLAESLRKKTALELQITQQFEELKELEISLEKCARAKPREEACALLAIEMVSGSQKVSTREV